MNHLKKVEIGRINFVYQILGKASTYKSNFRRLSKTQKGCLASPWLHVRKAPYRSKYINEINLLSLTQGCELRLKINPETGIVPHATPEAVVFYYTLRCDCNSRPFIWFSEAASQQFCTHK